MITFRKINKNNFEDFLLLDSGKEGVKHCATPQYTIIEALFDKSLDNVKGIYLNNEIIGMFHYYYINNGKTVWINRLMIDKKYQNKGFGKKSFIKLISSLKKDKNINRLELATSNPILLNLENKLGFEKLNNSRSKKFYQKYKEHIYFLSV